MRKVYRKVSKQAEGEMVENIIVAHSINSKILDSKFDIRAEQFPNWEAGYAIEISEPKIYVCNSSAMRDIAGAKKGEKLFVVRQTMIEVEL